MKYFIPGNRQTGCSWAQHPATPPYTSQQLLSTNLIPDEILYLWRQAKVVNARVTFSSPLQVNSSENLIPDKILYSRGKFWRFQSEGTNGKLDRSIERDGAPRLRAGGTFSQKSGHICKDLKIPSTASLPFCLFACCSFVFLSCWLAVLLSLEFFSF